MKMKGTESVPQPSPALRAPAPTITVDTPAVSVPQNVAAHPLRTPIAAYASQRDRDHSPRSTLSSPGPRQRSSSIENRPLLSFEPRPSPYNLSLPASEPPHLLTVPGTRSRANSLGGTHSISSYGEEPLFSAPATSDYEGSRRKSGDTVGFHGLRDDGSLKADPGDEHNFHVEDNPFAFSPGQLSKLFNPKCLAAFCALGGLRGIALGLRTDTSSGLSLDETTLDGTVKFDEVTVRMTFASSSSLVPRSTSSAIYQANAKRYVDRKRVFGMNRLPEKKAKSLFEIMWITFNDKVLVILTVVAAVSLGLAMYQDFGQPGSSGGPVVD